MIGCSTGAKARIGCESACRRESGSFFGLPALVQIARAAMVFMWMASPLPSPRGRGRNTQGRAQRWPVCGLHTPSGRAEKRRAWGGRGSAACRASCSDSLRLSERSERSERSEFRSAAPRPSIAGCPQRSEGTRPVGSPFSLVTFFLARQKESDCAAGRTSRPAAHRQKRPSARPRSASPSPHPPDRVRGRLSPQRGEGARPLGRAVPGAGARP